MIEEDIKTLADTIARQLGETDPQPLAQIANVVRLCGAEFAEEILQETLKIEEAGGMMIQNGDRRRTIGGVYFYLARGRMSAENRREIFGYRGKGGRNGTPRPDYPPFVWDERREIVESLLEAKGTVSDVNIKLIGRPGKIEARKDVVITTMEHTGKYPTLPKGIPDLPETSTLYTVYISARHWEKVEKAIEDPEDELLIDGLCAYDPDTESMLVYALNVTTRLLERAEKAKAKPAKPGGRPAGKPAAGTPPPKRSHELPRIPVAPPPVQVDVPDGMPPEAANRLRELHTAAATYRQKLDEIMAKPEDQRFGMEMTQKLLKATQDQIDALEKQYPA